jgi:hypothetical protein
MRRRNVRQGGAQTAVPHDALWRLGKKIQRECNIPPRPAAPDPVTGRWDPPGFYTMNHYTGQSLRPKASHKRNAWSESLRAKLRALFSR